MSAYFPDYNTGLVTDVTDEKGKKLRTLQVIMIAVVVIIWE